MGVTLPGPSKTIVVEPLEQPGEQPAPEPEEPREQPEKAERKRCERFRVREESFRAK